MKELVREEVAPTVAVQRLETLKLEVAAYLQKNPAKQNYMDYWLHGYDRDELHRLRDTIEGDVEYLSNSREKMVVLKLMDLPILRSLWFQQPSTKSWLSWTMMVIFPLGLSIWFYGRKTQMRLRDELATVTKVTDQLIELIAPENPQPTDNTIPTDGK